MPSGEVFTGPVETSAEGAHPLRRSRRRRAASRSRASSSSSARAAWSSARAERGDEYLQAMLDTDDGARVLGELGIGTNPRHRPPDRLDPVRREDRRHRPPRGRPLVSRDRRHQRVRHALGHDLRPPPGWVADRRRRCCGGRRRGRSERLREAEDVVGVVRGLDPLQAREVGAVVGGAARRRGPGRGSWGRRRRSRAGARSPTRGAATLPARSASAGSARCGGRRRSRLIVSRLYAPPQGLKSSSPCGCAASA